MKNIFKILLLPFSLIMLSSSVCHAEIAVIINSSVSEEASMNDIKKIFLGKSKSLPSGHKVTPIALAEGSSVRDEFNETVLKKSDSQLKSYWAKLIFTGKGRPPNDVGSDQDMISEISSDPNTIGYIDAKNVTPDVKVLLSF
tara:strand:- start:1933 stop:2358 length:426 start_codon:yes stop_codon:yes gene_type:complete